jgi:hypothetical protein
MPLRRARHLASTLADRADASGFYLRRTLIKECIMKKFVWTFAVFVAVLLPQLNVTSARAQAIVSWVSSTGSDNNTQNFCDASNPCLTFGAALSVLALGGEPSSGEVHCLGPYGLSNGDAAINITFSVTIDCHDGLGAIVQNGGTFTINGTNIIVTLRGLTLNGLAGNPDGLTQALNGIVIQSAAIVNIEDCLIEKFTGSGISVTTSANTVLNVRNTTIRNVANGVSLMPSGGAVNGSIDHAMIGVTSSDGITTNTGSVFFTVTNSLIVNAKGVGVSAGGAGTVLGVASSSVSNNNTAFATAGGVIRISRNEIYDNNTNFSISGGTIATAGNNDVAVNGSTVPNGTITQQ